MTVETKYKKGRLPYTGIAILTMKFIMQKFNL